MILLFLLFLSANAFIKYDKLYFSLIKPGFGNHPIPPYSCVLNISQSNQNIFLYFKTPLYTQLNPTVLACEDGYSFIHPAQSNDSFVPVYRIMPQGLRNLTVTCYVRGPSLLDQQIDPHPYVYTIQKNEHCASSNGIMRINYNSLFNDPRGLGVGVKFDGDDEYVLGSINQDSSRLLAFRVKNAAGGLNDTVTVDRIMSEFTDFGLVSLLPGNFSSYKVSQLGWYND